MRSYICATAHAQTSKESFTRIFTDLEEFGRYLLEI